jgi:hypothetical protein
MWWGWVGKGEAWAMSERRMRGVDISRADVVRERDESGGRGSARDMERWREWGGRERSGRGGIDRESVTDAEKGTDTDTDTNTSPDTDTDIDIDIDTDTDTETQTDKPAAGC